MIRDPFGGWDWDGIRQLLSVTLFLLFIISFAASTAGKWSDPYYWAWGIVVTNAPLAIVIVMLGMMGLWWFDQFNKGLY